MIEWTRLCEKWLDCVKNYWGGEGKSIFLYIFLGACEIFKASDDSVKRQRHSEDDRVWESSETLIVVNLF
jgi:hypothetical protein